METRFLLWVHAHSHPFLDALFTASHYAGTAWFGAALVLAMALWHRARREGARALAWLGLGTGVLLLQLGLKELFARPRPELWLDHRWAISPGSYAFPSGHAMMAAALYPLLALSLSAARPAARAWCWLAAVAIALWIGLGRVYLGVHWPSDVAAGWALGAALVAPIGARFFRRAPPSG